MKLRYSLLIFSSLLIPFTAVNADNLKGCAAKKQNIENQIQYAKQAGNTHRVQGLERALQKTNTYCNDESLNKDRLEKVSEKERKVQKRQQELNEAKSKNDSKKIEKKQKKLAEAKAELNEAKLELKR